MLENYYHFAYMSRENEIFTNVVCATSKALDQPAQSDLSIC